MANPIAPTPYSPSTATGNTNNPIASPNPYPTTAQSLPAANTNPTGTTAAPAVVSGKEATTQATNMQNAMNQKIASAASIAAAKQNMVTTYDAQGNMIKTGGVMDNGNTYQELYTPGMAGYIANPATVKATQDKIAADKKAADDAAQTASLTAAATGSTPTNNNQNTVQAPPGVDASGVSGQIQWYQQDPQSFDAWAKAQGWSEANIATLHSEAATSQLQQDTATYNAKLAQLANGTYPLTPDQQAALDALKKQWDSTIEAQTKANQTYSNAAGMMAARSGRGEYNPINVAGSVQQAIDIGINRIAQFQAAQTEALANMRQGFMDSNFKNVTTAYNALVNNDKNILDALNHIQDVAIAAQKDLRDFTYKQQQDKITNDLNSDKFTYQQKQDMIDNELKKADLSETVRHNLQLEKERMAEIAQGNLWKTQDAYGNPVVINTQTGAVQSYQFNPTQSEGINSENNDSYLKALNNALINSPAPEVKRVKGEVSQYLKNGDYNGAKEEILRVAAANLGVDQQNQIIGRLQAESSLNNIKSLINGYVSQSGDTSLLKGSIENAINQIGNTTDPKLVTIKNQAAQSLQDYRRAMTGVAFSPAEAAQYAAIFPKITDVSSLSITKIDSLLNTFQRNQKNAIGFSIGASNYDQIFGNPTDPLNLGTPYSTPNKSSNPLGI